MKRIVNRLYVNFIAIEEVRSLVLPTRFVEGRELRVDICSSKRSILTLKVNNFVGDVSINLAWTGN